jgi:hypothetical protein
MHADPHALWAVAGVGAVTLSLWPVGGGTNKSTLLLLARL